ncbi:MAG: hypothetical protein DID90_2727552700 [Candidatus Nitrotoga sp. LAW]|nr:MAG: hypothetical protein DID90_2727552700 [Candidatus Nitrotoga sp. LAW]
MRDQPFCARRRELPQALGLHPAKPIKKAYEQRPEAVQAWLGKDYPEIEQRTKAEGAKIHWGDETMVVHTDVRGRSYAPIGKTPVTFAVGGTRQKLSMIGYHHQPRQDALNDH